MTDSRSGADPSQPLATGAVARLTAALSDRYAIERELGQGGMATVYLAEDLKHHRKVAIKVLRPDLAAALGPDRFMQEIEIAARLQHPHILGVHDSGQADGFLYYVMPYVEGESLRERLSRQGELPIHEAVRLLSEIADALGHAHARGVVHRDIKPENVMLSGRHALVMDFGVAKAVNEASGQNRLTTLGVALGTPAYMAPEQASADPHLDHRVDIYALGVVGYELLAGRPPFTGGSPQQVLAAHVTQAPDLVSTHRPAISAALTAVIMRALEKRPADRWQTAEEMLAQLEPLATPSGGLTPTSTRPVAAVGRSASAPRRVPRWALITAAIVAILGASYGGFKVFGGRAGAVAGTQSVAVLPFDNLGGDSTNRSFADGIQGEILTDLTRIAALQVTSRRSVLEYRNTAKPMKQIGVELGVRTLLQGQVQRSGDQVHVTVQLVDAPTDRQIWAESYDRELTAQNVFTIQGDIARNVAQALRASFPTSETAAVDKPPTSSLEALDWYHRGRELFANRSGSSIVAAGISAFEHAVAIDSGFAGAWAGLAAIRSWQVFQGVTVDTLPARIALDRAVALAPTSPETEIARAYYAYYGRRDFTAALTHFRSVAAARPNDVDAIAGVGYISRRQGRWADAISAQQKVATLDPRYISSLNNLGVTYLAIRQYDKAEAMFQRALISDPSAETTISDLVISMVGGRGDTAAARALIGGLPAGVPARIHDTWTVLLERLARHFDLSNEIGARLPDESLTDHASSLIGRAMNDLAAGATEHARRRADSTIESGRVLLARLTGPNASATRATLLGYVAVAEAIQGRAADALQDGEEAIRLDPVSRDKLEGPRSVDGLIVVHLILGHRDEAIRLIIQEAHEAIQSQSIVPISQAMIRLDPLFDGIRNDPRIQALLKDDAAWVVK